MNETDILAASAETALLEIAKQAEALGVGLQTAAPGDKTGAPNYSVLYLLSVSEMLAKKAEECKKLSLGVTRRE